MKQNFEKRTFDSQLKLRMHVRKLNCFTKNIILYDGEGNKKPIFRTIRAVLERFAPIAIVTEFENFSLDRIVASVEAETSKCSITV